MYIVSGLFRRKIIRETADAPSGDATHLLYGLVVRSETEALLFEFLKIKQTFNELVQSVLDEYDTDPSLLTQMSPNI